MIPWVNRPYINVWVSYNALNENHDTEIGFCDERRRIISSICFSVEK